MLDASGALAHRRSCRSYLDAPVDPDVLASVLAAASRGPTAGNTWGIDLVVLDRPADVAAHWERTLPSGPRREAFPWPGLLRAPVLVIPVIDPAAYVRRYAEPDKARTGLGDGDDRWPVPYWWVDAGAAVMAMLVAATAHGLGSLLFGLFDREAVVAEALGVPEGRRLVGAVALGWPDGEDRPSRSAARARPAPERFVHRSRW